MYFTVLGSTGFIGRHLTRSLRSAGYECFAPSRNDPTVLERDLGHVVYCIGLTADWRTQAHATVEAHITVLQRLLERGRFDSLLYLSSTRVYRGTPSGNEATTLSVNPNAYDDLFNLTKLTGEALCLAGLRDRVRVARLSNVYGDDIVSDNFLTSIIRDALMSGHIILRTSRDSSKDYVSIHDVVDILPQIAMRGSRALYNVGSGYNVCHGALVDRLHQLTKCNVVVEPGAPTVQFPQIDITAIRTEFGFEPRALMTDLDALVTEFAAHVSGVPADRPQKEQQ